MSPRQSWVLLACTAALVLAPAAAFAEPVYWDENGHYYELVEQLVTWEEAEDMAANMSFMGAPGYLATITSVEENDFVWAEMIGDDPYPPVGDPWIGGYQHPAESPPGENWHWVTEEAWEFANWSWSEPNDYCEPYGEMYLQFAGCCAGMWNDHHSEVPKAFIVEYSSDIVASETSSWSDVKSLFR